MLFRSGGELLAVMNGITVTTAFAKQLTLTEKCTIHIFHDYNGIARFIEGRPVWNPKKDGAKLYVNMIKQFKQQHPNIIIKFTKVKAHTGNKWNEVADAIANGVNPSECEGKMLKEYIS